MVVAAGRGLAALGDGMLRRADLMADLLAIHTDYSLWESFLRLDAIEKVRNPNFPQVLLENASCRYCRSHQYELARHLYAPRARGFVEKAKRLHAQGDRKTPLLLDIGPDYDAFLKRPLESLRPTSPRTPEAFRALMLELAR